MNPFFGGHTKRVLYVRKLLAKVTQNFSGKSGIFGEKSRRKFACSYTYVQGLAKIIFAEGAKSGKISFSPSETKKTTFFAKTLMGKCQISKSWGGLPFPPSREADLFGILFDVFTNKHIMNNIFKIYLLIR